ncbi:MAG: hypothetical protein Tsb009_20000 [Planctomycetaceae bacterium]
MTVQSGLFTLLNIRSFQKNENLVSGKIVPILRNVETDFQTRRVIFSAKIDFLFDVEVFS